MKSVLRPFTPSTDSRRGSYQLLAIVCAQVLFNGLEVCLSRKRVIKLTDRLDMAFIMQTGLSVKSWAQLFKANDVVS